MLELLRPFYVKVQTALQWWKKLVSILNQLGFKQVSPDTCIMIKKTYERDVFIGLYVDDFLCIRDKKSLEQLEEDLKKASFTIKVEKGLNNYLSCDIEINHDKTRAILRQPHLLKALKQDFGKEVKGLMSYKTPGTPGKGLIKTPEDVTVNNEDHKRYISGTGTLFYLVKHSRPDITNAARELSKVFNSVTPITMKEIKHIIKNVLDTREYGLRIKPVTTADGII